MDIWVESSAVILTESKDLEVTSIKIVEAPDLVNHSRRVLKEKN